MSIKKTIEKISPKMSFRQGSMKVLMRELFDPSLDIDRMGATLFGKTSKAEIMYKELRKNKFETHTLMAKSIRSRK